MQKYILFFLFIYSINSVAFSQVIINEIMYNPSNDEPEWIELFNKDNSIFNDSLRIEDPVRTYSFYPGNFLPNSYIILVDDSLQLKNHRKIPDSATIIQTKIPGLNNDKDSLFLKNSADVLIDRFIYKGTWAKKGYSLERVSPNSTAETIDEVKQSLANDSATCGRVNSNFSSIIDTLPTSNLIEISPNPFSPHATNGKNVCKINLQISEEIENLIINIYDLNGNSILELAKNPTKLSAGIYEFEWNGYNQHGYSVQTGIYPIIISYTILKRNETFTYKKLIVVGL